MKCAVTTLDNKKAGEIDLDDGIFGLGPRPDLLARMVNWQLAKRRTGTHKVQGRSDVKGTTQRMYRQKGTGRARQGTRSAPHYAGGGVVFGPSPRKYDKRLPKRMRRLALVGALTSKFDDGAIKVVNDLSLDETRTKHLVGHFAALQASGKILVVEDGKNEALELSARNIPDVIIIRSDSLNIVDVLDADAIVITAPSIPTMSEVYA